MQRLGKNSGGYFGEPLEVDRVFAEIIETTKSGGWQLDSSQDGASNSFLGFHKISLAARGKIYISAGIHGDEPAGPLAVLELLRKNAWPQSMDFWLCPCLNPSGFRVNRRENSDGIDLNRDYRHLRSREVRTHVEWLDRQPRFDVSICLHEDWEANGFYVYEVNPDGQPSHAEIIVHNVSSICPVEYVTEVDGWPAEGGVIRPGKDPMLRPEWPEALYLIVNKTRLSYTLESPSDFPLETRVRSLVMGVQTILEQVQADFSQLR